MMKVVLISMAVVLALAGGGGWYWYAHSAPPVAFRTAEVTRGELIPTIGATGTIEPQDTVDVGAQINGRIVQFGVDTNGNPVDNTSHVKQGELLARIDDSVASAVKVTAEAQLALAQAGVRRAQADLQQLGATRDQKQSVWLRAQVLGKSDALSKNDYEVDQADAKIAEANYQVGLAAIDQANATVLQAKANLQQAEENLGYCTINCPVDGVIIDRRVNVGQTVVAGLNAPSLFLIAKDLKQMRIWVSVNEADIGNVYTGQKVNFTVDMLPGEVFHGSVGIIRLSAQMTQNVVTYTVEINMDNSDGRLKPYLTANVQFEVADYKDVLMVPNAALRWYPQAEMVAPDVRAALADKSKKPDDMADPLQKDKPAARPTTAPATGPSPQPLARKPHGHGTLWVIDGKFVRPIKVHTGATDGINTEITVKDDALREGAPIVVGIQQEQADDADTNNPFAPKNPWARKH